MTFFVRSSMPALVLALLLVGCGETGTEPVEAGPPAALRVEAGAGQEGVVAETLGLPVRVVVEDSLGTPLPGVAVSFQASGDGFAQLGTVMTDDAGVAETTWTLSTTAGAQTLTAAVAALTADVSATAGPADPADLTLIEEVAATGAPGESIGAVAVALEDAYGNPIGGHVVEFSTADGGSLGPVEVLTDAAGAARSDWTLGPDAGEQEAVASAADFLSVEIRVTVTAVKPNEAPEVTILAPADGATFDEGVTVELRGEASDLEEGELSGDALAWSSDVAGDLGNGIPLEVSDLAVGEHEITLTATDSAGTQGSASVRITVEERQSASFTTVGFSAPYACCTISAAVDDQHRTHVAWVDSTGSDVMMHTVVEGGAATSTVVAHGDELLRHAVMALDDAGAPHFAYVEFRNWDGDCPATGQESIVYAHDADGDGTFETDVVDTRGEACPTDDYMTAEGSYPAIETTPGIAFAEDGTVTVFYYSFGPGSNREFMVRARLEAGEWNRTVVLNYQDEDVERDQGGVHVAQRLTTNEYIPYATYQSMSSGFATLSGGAWETTVFPEYGYGNVAIDPRIHTDLAGTTHMTWYSTGEDAWLHGTLTDGTLSASIDTVVVGLRTSGSVEPSAIDPVTGGAYYYAAVDSYVDPAFFSVPDPSGGRTEIEVDLPGFLPFGRVLNVHDGFISLVTRDLDSATLYVHTTQMP